MIAPEERMAIVRVADDLLKWRQRTNIQRQNDRRAVDALMRLLAEDELERSQREGDL